MMLFGRAASLSRRNQTKAGTETRASRLRLSSQVALLILLLAWCLRLYHLDFQSLWSDEGISLLRAASPLSEMLRDMPVEHAPGYFVLLHAWLGLAGDSDFALRFFSVWPGLLAVALAYRLGADLGSRGAGLAAALLLATNAFQVWYAQEARMYSWLLIASLVATWCLWRLLERPGRAPASWRRGQTIGLQAGYSLAIAITVYVHHFGFLVPAAHAVFVLWWLWGSRDWEGVWRWALAGAGAALLYLPWLPRLLGIFGFAGWRDPMDPSQLPWRYFTAYSVGDTMPGGWRDWLPWLYLCLVLAGAVVWWQRRPAAAKLLLSAVTVPLAGAVFLAIRQPDYHERYVIMVSAPLLLLAAGGLVGLGDLMTRQNAVLRRYMTVAGTALLGLLVASNVFALEQLYTDSSLHKPDYRAAAVRIQSLEKPGDVVLVDGPDPQKVFLHYYTGSANIHDLRNLQGAPEGEIDRVLSEATRGAKRTWNLLYFHEPGPVQAWLARHGWPAAESVHNNIRVTLYGLPLEGGEDLETVEAPAGGGLTMVGVAVRGDEETPTAPRNGEGGRFSVRGGELVRVTTQWRVAGVVPAVKFSLRLQDGGGRTWVAEDYVPAGIQEGVDRHGLLVPPDVPPGTYEVTLIVYDPGTGTPLDGAGEAEAEKVLASIQVLPPPAPPAIAGLAIPTRSGKSLGADLVLLGYDVSPQPLRAGQKGELTLWWQAARRPAPAYGLGVEVTRGRRVAASRQVYPLSSAPTGTWQPGQIVRERYPIEVEPAAAAGEYTVRLALLDADGSPMGPSIEIGTVSVEARSRLYRLPQVSHPVEMHLAENITLRGYDLEVAPGAGRELRLALYWQADAAVSTRYKVFVHLVDRAGNIAAQSDAIPAGGEAPSESWLAEEVVVDRHVLAAPAAGSYRLLAGLYEPESGQRPPVTDETGHAVTDGAILLQEVQVP